jgi:hypothetical protein
MLSEDFCSTRWVTGQHAGGEIECLTGSLDRMGPMCHRAPALSSPARNGRVMNLSPAWVIARATLRALGFLMRDQTVIEA